MGEARRKARLLNVLGEKRADNYAEFLDDIAALKPTTPAEHDRVVFMRLMGTAIVEALRERDPEGAVDASRFYEMTENLAFVAGVYTATNIFARLDDTQEARVLWGNVITQAFAAGVLRAMRPDEASTERGSDG